MIKIRDYPMKTTVILAFRFLCLLSILCLSGNALADLSQYQIDADAADAYADAYSAQDLPALAELLAEQAVFIDPSNRYEGRDTIIEGLSETFKRIISSGPETRSISKFRSGNEFIHTAFIEFNMLMAVGELAESEYNFKVDFVMITKVQDGKIVQHTDYLDTHNFVAQLQAQVATKQE